MVNLHGTQINVDLKKCFFLIPGYNGYFHSCVYIKISLMKTFRITNTFTSHKNQIYVLQGGD